MKLGIAITLALLSVSALAGTEVKLNSGTINTKNVRLSLNDNLAQQTEWIVQFKGRITEKTKIKLTQNGIVVYNYIPEDALIVRADYKTAKALLLDESVQAVLAFQPQMKLSPTLGLVTDLTSETRETFIVSVFNQNERSTIESKIKNNVKNILIQKSAARNFVITTERRHLALIAAVPGVENIQAFVQVEPLHKLFDESDVSTSAAGDYSDINGFETGTKVMNFGSAWALGLSGQNQVVGMADTGLDSGDSRAIHPDFLGAVKSGYAVGMFGKTWADTMGHGTHVAGSVLGRGTASSGLLKGGAYSAQMVVQGMWSPILNN